MAEQGYLTIDFLDVGQGDGTFIITPRNACVLIDLGSKKNADVAGRDAIAYLKSRIEWIQAQRSLPKPTVDYLMLTHGDLDHYNLIDTLRAAFLPAELQFGYVYVGGLIDEYGTLAPFLRLMKLAGKCSEFANCQHDATDQPLFTFGSLLYGPVYGYLLSSNVPNKTKTGNGAKNQKSIVMLFEYAGRKIILTGDAEDEMEGRVLDWYSASPAFLRCDALKLGHHGSQAGTTREWLEALQPWCVFASSDQKWAHPYCVTLERVLTYAPIKKDLDPPHPWLCGKGANASKQYFNHFSESERKWGIYTTLAFQQFAEKDSTEAEVEIMGEIQKVYDPDKVLEDGLVQGAQYQIEITPAGKMSILTTLHASPDLSVVMTEAVLR